MSALGQKQTFCGAIVMSALGQKQTYAPQKRMSALPPIADMCGATSDVRFGPKADIIVIRSPRRRCQARSAPR
jgi:hypothetical protein